MEPTEKQRPTHRDETETQAPVIEQQDWDAFEGNRVIPDSDIAEGGVPVSQEVEGSLPEQDDDNAYQNSDEALPDDEEERALSRDPSREGSRFDEI